MNTLTREGAMSPHGSLLPVVIATIQIILQALFEMVLSAVYALLPYSWLPKKDVSEKVVLITGAASGIGRLLAIRFAELGAKLALLDLNPEANEETERIILDERPSVIVRSYICDLNDRQNVYDVMRQVQAELGDVDILINNAGIVTGKKILECPDELMIKTMNVNTLSHFWMIKAVLPSMLERNHGHIVTIASAGGLFGVAGLVDYCASKFATIGLTEALTFELRNQGKNGIHTTTVCPFYINTGMFHGASTRFPWVLPIMEPTYVADNIVNAIVTNQEVLILPRILYLANFMKSFLPAQTSYKIADFLGITHGMDEFIGRKPTYN